MDGFLEICPDRVFDPVYDFHYFGAGICYMIYSMSMLILQSNTFKLLRQYRQLELKQLMSGTANLEAMQTQLCEAYLTIVDHSLAIRLIGRLNSTGRCEEIL